MKIRKLSKGIYVLSEKRYEATRYDEWGKGHWNEMITIKHIWRLKGGFAWLIDCGDFSVCEKRLSEATIIALKLISDDPPVYYRLKEHLQTKGLWKTL